MQNYHRHTSYSNIYTADSSAMNDDYAKRAVELGHKILSSVEHGFQGYYYETFELAKKYNLKFIFGAEAYWVKDRLKEYPNGINEKTGEVKYSKDRTNGHIILLAKTEIGRRSINRILSDANEDGYYYRPRVDIELLLSLPPKDVLITTACVAFWHYEDIEDILIKLHNHFKDNLMLEIQNHNTKKQITLNKRIIELSKKYGIEMIVGLDSHYIDEEQAIERDYVLEAKGIHYEDEDGWYMDYPDDDTVFQRFKTQNIFTDEQIKNAMDNTDNLLEFDDLHLDDNIKLPTLYPELSQDEKNKLYSQLVTKHFKEYMKDIPKEEYDRYFEGVKNEVQVIKNTGMADYFLIDNAIVNRALEKGGIITDSGRGSGVGYFTNTLLGFSKVDRFTSPIKLYPERFISESRILETKSLPDLDLNTGNPEVFAEAQEEILGKGHAYPMIAFGTFRRAAAFKMYAKAKKLDFTIANAISQQLKKYEDAVKYAEDDEKDEIDVFEYVDEKYHSYIRNSEIYMGIIADKKKAPCFTQGTLINTEYGYIPIEKIEKDMKVFTHTGVLKEVVYKDISISDDIFALSTIGRENIYVTGDHPMYSMKQNIERYKQQNGNWSKRKSFNNPEWIPIKNLSERDMIGSLVNNNSIIPKYSGLEKYMENSDFWWIIGRYLGDGWTEYYEPENRERVKICCSYFKNEISDISSKLDNLFKYRIDKCNTTYKIIIKNKDLFGFLQLFGNKAEGKVIPNFVIDLPVFLLEKFIEGYISADGHYQKNIRSYQITTVSRNLAYGFQQCIHKIYKRPTTLAVRSERVEIIQGRKVNCKKSYTVKFHKDIRKKDRNFFKDGYMWYQIAEISPVKKSDHVYNMEVKDDNSYTVNNLIAHNCAYLIYQGNIREEIGLIKCKSDTTKKEYITTVIDGAIAEKYKFLKNDLLKVDVVLLIDAIFKRAKAKHLTVNELMEVVKDNKKVWDIYANGYTVGVNQCEKPSTTNKLMNYRPTNISELSAFIAAIRPAFKSMYKKFETREHFSYGINAFDKIIQTKEFPQSFILYQEQTMNTLNYAGFPIDECYGIIKAIAKKHPEKVRPLKARFIEGFKARIIEDDNVSEDEAVEMSDKVWQIISDSCGYGFNSAHAFCMALDSLYNAYQKSHFTYEFYEVMLQMYSAKGKKDKVAILKQEMKRAFDIDEGDYKFGLDNRNFQADKKNKVIYPSLLSLKGLSQSSADDLYKLSQKTQFTNFYDLYKRLVKLKSVNAGKRKVLIKIGYFSDFGSVNKIEEFITYIDALYDRKEFSKEKTDRKYLKYIIPNSTQTEKQYNNFDYDTALYQVWNDLEDSELSLQEKLNNELEYLGYVKTTLPNLSPEYAFVQEYECKFKNPKIALFRLCNGDVDIVKIKRKNYDESPINVGDVIKTIECSNEGRWFNEGKDEDGKDIWRQDKNDEEVILKKWNFVR